MTAAGERQADSRVSGSLLTNAAAHPEAAPLLYDALTPPFAVRALEQDRLLSRVLVARSGGLWERCRDAMAPLEAHLPCRPDMLRARARRRRIARSRSAASARNNGRTLPANRIPISNRLPRNARIQAERTFTQLQGTDGERGMRPYVPFMPSKPV